MIISDLQELDDDDLQEYFEENARYYPQSPEDSKYAIQLGSRSLFSDDTRKLRNEFFREVRSE